MGKRAKKYSVIQRQIDASKLDAEYHKKEKLKHAFRSDSAYQLIDLDHSYKLFRPGQTVLDLGCAPGSWTQVAVQATEANYAKSNSVVVGVDIKQTEKIEGATLIKGLDFSLDDSQDTVIRALRYREADIVLSDMAYQKVGDDSCVTNLHYSVLEFVKRICVQGGSMVMRVFPGRGRKELMEFTSDLFNKLHIVSVDKTLNRSQEMFYVGLGFKAGKWR